MDLQLAGRVVLVVGGAGFIGSAIVERLREEGATALVGSRSADEGVRLDATDPDSVAAAIARVVDEHGRLDGVVMTAAPAANTLDPARASDPVQIAEATDRKALSFLRVASAAAPVMRDAGYGRIVGIAGQLGALTGNITATVRNVTLGVVAKSLADELAGTGVTVNVVNPANVRAEPDPVVQPTRGGDSSPEQIADLVAFLVSPRSVLSGESIAIGHRILGIV